MGLRATGPEYLRVMGLMRPGEQDALREAAAIGWDACVAAMRYEDGSPVEVVTMVNPYRAPADKACPCGGRLVPETNRGVEHHICTECNACDHCDEAVPCSECDGSGMLTTKHFDEQPAEPHICDYCSGRGSNPAAKGASEPTCAYE